MKVIWIHNDGHVLILLADYLYINLYSPTYYTHTWNDQVPIVNFVFTFDALSHPAYCGLYIPKCWYINAVDFCLKLLTGPRSANYQYF